MSVEALAPPAPFAVRLPLFEGPFDLLLFFIERDELDVHDIPIARVTAEFMAYLQTLEQLNMELAADFILTAASLMRIKAKMLLPRREVDEKGEELDPRRDLVRHLIEYRRYKEAVAELAAMEADMLRQYPRGNTEAELQALAQRAQPTPEDELHDVTLYKLLRVYEKAMARFEADQARPRHTVFLSQYTVDQQKDYLRQLTSRNRRVPFTEVLTAFQDRLGVVFTFIALLELLQLGQLELGEDPRADDEPVGFNQFWVAATASAG